MPPVSLAKLVGTSVARKSPRPLFVSLLKQLLQRGELLDAELLDKLLDLPHHNHRTLQLQYALAYALLGAAELARFFALLPRLPPDRQRTYVVHLKATFAEVFRDALLKDFVASALVAYTTALARDIARAPNAVPGPAHALFVQVLFLWGAVIDRCAHLVPLAPFKELAAAVTKALAVLDNAQLTAYFARKAGAVLTSVDFELAPDLAARPEPVSMAAIKKSYTLAVTSKKLATYLRIKKFVWLNAQLLHWLLDNLLDRYFLFFKVPMQKPSDVIDEVVAAFFGGILVALLLREHTYVVFNWKNFIVSVLPELIKTSSHLHALNAVDNAGELLAAAVAAYNNPQLTLLHVGCVRDKPYDLRKAFLRSCIYQNVITLKVFVATFPEEADALSASLITHETEQLNHVDLLTSDLNTKLTNINTEFTSLEESKLVNYFQSLPSTNIAYLAMKQKQLSKLIHSLVDSFVSEKNNEKLCRLLLALLNCLPVANYVFFCEQRGPANLLNKLISYIDGETFTVDDDDSNFQDTYAYFGVLLSGVVSIAVFFGTDLHSIDIKSSYTVDYINKFFYRLCDDLTSEVTGSDEDEMTIAQNYNTLFGDWVNALFDVNNDGLSDDLLKSMTVKQIYKLIFIIFQRSISARVVGSLSASALSNGIDYLSQNFLVPCSMEIIHWIATKIGPKQPCSDAMMTVLLRIFECNVGDGQTNNMSGTNYTLRMILNNVAPGLLWRLKSLKNGQSSDLVSKLMNILRKEVDLEYAGHSLAAEQPIVGKITLAETMKEEVVKYTRGNVESDVAAIGSSWLKINQCWQTIPAVEIRFALEHDLEQCSRARAKPGSTSIEEAKIFLDFLVFMLVATSNFNREDAAKFTALIGEKKTVVLPLDLEDKAFSLTMDHHYSSIFNETNGENSPAEVTIKEDSNPPKVDFEMDDLFDDISEDLFGDPMNQMAALAQAAPIGNVPASLEGIYREARASATPLAQVARLLLCSSMLVGANAHQLSTMAQLRLIHELEQWA